MQGHAVHRALMPNSRNTRNTCSYRKASSWVTGFATVPQGQVGAGADRPSRPAVSAVATQKLMQAVLTGLAAGGNCFAHCPPNLADKGRGPSSEKSAGSSTANARLTRWPAPGKASLIRRQNAHPSSFSFANQPDGHPTRHKYPVESRRLRASKQVFFHGVRAISAIAHAQRHDCLPCPALFGRNQKPMMVLASRSVWVLSPLACGLGCSLESRPNRAVDVANHLPAIGLETLGRVIGKPANAPRHRWRCRCRHI